MGARALEKIWNCCSRFSRMLLNSRFFKISRRLRDKLAHRVGKTAEEVSLKFGKHAAAERPADKLKVSSSGHRR